MESLVRRAYKAILDTTGINDWHHLVNSISDDCHLLYLCDGQCIQKEIVMEYRNRIFNQFNREPFI